MKVAREDFADFYTLSALNDDETPMLGPDGPIVVRSAGLRNPMAVLQRLVDKAGRGPISYDTRGIV